MNESPARVRQPIDLDEFERRLRSAANPSHADQDPLAELARLVGQGNPAAAHQEQPQLQNSLPSHQALPEPQDYAAPHIHRPDPSFNPRLRDPAPLAERTYSSAPEAQGHESQVPVDMGQIEAQMRDFRRNYEPMANTAPRQEPSFDGQHSVNADPRNADARSYADPRIDSSAYAPEPAYLDDVEVEPKPRRTLWLASAGLVVVMGAIGLGFVYKGGAKLGGEAPTILAAAGPTKVQPPNPTNSDTTNASSTILDKGQADRVTASKIVTREEQPVDLAAQRPIPRDVTAAASPIPAVPAVQKSEISTPVPPASQAAAPAVVPPAIVTPQPSNNGFPEPRRVKTVSVRPDGTVIPNDPPAAAPLAIQPKPPAAAASTPAVKPVAPAPKPVTPAASAPKPVVTAANSATANKDNASKTTARATTNANANNDLAALLEEDVEDSPRAAAPARPATSAPKPITPAAGGDSGYAAQLASTSSEEEAKDMIGKLQKRFPSQLSGYKPTVVKATVNDRQVYRIRIVGLTKAQADNVCGSVKSGGGACIPAKN
jgi:hypothetical protein